MMIGIGKSHTFNAIVCELRKIGYRILYIPNVEVNFYDTIEALKQTFSDDKLVLGILEGKIITEEVLNDIFSRKNPEYEIYFKDGPSNSVDRLENLTNLLTLRKYKSGIQPLKDLFEWATTYTNKFLFFI